MCVFVLFVCCILLKIDRLSMMTQFVSVNSIILKQLMMRRLATGHEMLLL